MSHTSDTDHRRYLAHAIQLATRAVDEDRGGPFGAVVVFEGQVVGTGCNEVTSRNDPTAHAEVLAIRAACQELQRFHLAGAVLYASCEPCPMCLATAHWAHVDAIYCASSTQEAVRAGFDDATIYTELRRPVEERHLRVVTLAVEGAKVPFERWSQSPTKQPY